MLINVGALIKKYLYLCLTRVKLFKLTYIISQENIFYSIVSKFNRKEV